MWVNKNEYEHLKRQLDRADARVVELEAKPPVTNRTYVVVTGANDETHVIAANVVKPGTYSGGFGGYSVVSDYTFVGQDGGVVAVFPVGQVRYIYSEDGK